MTIWQVESGTPADHGLELEHLLDEVIRLWLDPGFMAIQHGEHLITPDMQIETVRKNAPGRDYGVQFAARVMGVLGEEARAEGAGQVVVEARNTDADVPRRWKRRAGKIAQSPQQD